MKKELLTILCMTLVCASVMLGIMGIYKIFGSHHKKTEIIPDEGIEMTAFRNDGLKQFL